MPQVRERVRELTWVDGGNLLEWYREEVARQLSKPDIIEPIDFVALWIRAGLTDMICGPRQIISHRLDPLGPYGDFGETVAFELTAAKDPCQRVVLRASDEFPTDIEIASTAEEVSRLLNGLVPRAAPDECDPRCA